jgi:S-ribosylhomocysteine lyase LuxS involved in autoinducer biosynthesis
MGHNEVIALAKKIFEFIRDAAEIPNCSPEECPNYKEHHLDGARKEATLYLPILNRWSGDLLAYPETK